MLRTLEKHYREVSRERSPVPEIISFRTTRRAVGYLGLSLPFVLVLGSFLWGECCIIQPSISHYYYTNMREIFVGVLCAVALFLFTYKGNTMLDGIAANMAGVFSLGVALFPTGILLGYPGQHDVVSVIDIRFHQVIHITCASFFFGTLAFMSIVLFTKSNRSKRNQTPEKRLRNRIYLACGSIMLACIGMIGLSFLLQAPNDSPIVFVFETIALLAFGFSWLVKGETVFGDKIKYT